MFPKLRLSGRVISSDPCESPRHAWTDESEIAVYQPPRTSLLKKQQSATVSVPVSSSHQSLTSSALSVSAACLTAPTKLRNLLSSFPTEPFQTVSSLPSSSLNEFLRTSSSSASTAEILQISITSSSAVSEVFQTSSFSSASSPEVLQTFSSPLWGSPDASQTSSFSLLSSLEEFYAPGSSSSSSSEAVQTSGSSSSSSPVVVQISSFSSSSLPEAVQTSSSSSSSLLEAVQTSSSSSSSLPEAVQTSSSSSSSLLEAVQTPRFSSSSTLEELQHTNSTPGSSPHCPRAPNTFSRSTPEELQHAHSTPASSPVWLQAPPTTKSSEVLRPFSPPSAESLTFAPYSSVSCVSHTTTASEESLTPCFVLPASSFSFISWPSLPGGPQCSSFESDSSSSNPNSNLSLRNSKSFSPPHDPALASSSSPWTLTVKAGLVWQPRHLPPTKEIWSIRSSAVSSGFPSVGNSGLAYTSKTEQSSTLRPLLSFADDETDLTSEDTSFSLWIPLSHRDLAAQSLQDFQSGGSGRKALTFSLSKGEPLDCDDFLECFHGYFQGETSGDSDSDAQIDSMSSSDLEHCEDLQAFELAQNHEDIQSFPGGDHGVTPSPIKEAVADQNELYSPDIHERHVMNLREFEQLSPPSDYSEADLLAMWEDGGRLNVGGSFRGSVDGRVQVLQDDVSVLTKTSVHGQTGHRHDASNDFISFEERNHLIEQTLSEIYESPFQKLIFPGSQTPPQSPNSHIKTSVKSTRFELPDVDKSLRTVQLKWADNSIADRHVEAFQEETGRDCKEVPEDIHKKVKESVPEPDTQVTMKASIAFAAKRAVSGYRSCNDADSYVGTHLKPTLILARAPPSPSGILRRTNRKAAVKQVHCTVRWADGRPQSISPTDETT